MRLFLTFLFILISIVAEGQTQYSSLYDQYETDRFDYLEFESKHRGFVKGKNMTLSYLHWGTKSENTFIWMHDFDDFADDLLVLLDSFSVKKAVVAGFSRGGYLATSFYNRYPNRVKGLVLEDGGTAKFYGHFYQQNKQEQEQILSVFDTPEELRSLYFSETDTEFAQYKNLYEEGSKQSQFKILGLIKNKGSKYITYQGLDSYYQLENSLQAGKTLRVPESVSRYGRSIVQQEPMEIYQKLQIPLLLLEATKQPDPFPQDKENEMLKIRHPEWVTHVKFPNASHNIHYECSEEFLAVLLSFLSKFQ